MPDEAAVFLNEVMGLNLSAEDVSALETRTESWIAGLQLTALSLQGHADMSDFIWAFAGSESYNTFFRRPLLGISSDHDRFCPLQQLQWS
jgi:hypothetical protein